MNLMFTGRQVSVCYVPVLFHERLHDNLSVIPTEFDFGGAQPLPYVESVTLSFQGGVDAVHLPPAPYQILVARVEATPPDITINFLYTPAALTLLQLFNTAFHRFYLEYGLDLLIINKTTLGGFYLPSCVPKTLSLNYSEGRLLSCSLGLGAPAAFVIPDNHFPQPLPHDTPPTFVRIFTTTFNDEHNIPPLATVSLSISVNNNVSHIHSMLASFPQEGHDALSVRLPRLWVFGIPAVSSNIKLFAQPSSLPHYADGMFVDLSLQGYDLEMMPAALSIHHKGVIQSISLNATPSDVLFYNVSVVGVGDESVPPILFTEGGLL